MTQQVTPDEEVDRPADAKIVECLTGAQPKSFFLFAGAGSGKTASLVSALAELNKGKGAALRLRGQRIGVITYTNAACDEITRRIDFGPLVSVSTIHSFVWELIKGLNNDIRKWLSAHLTSEIAKTTEEERKGRAGTDASAKRLRDIERYKKRIDTLPSIKTFVYSPTGDNSGRDSLSHGEVIRAAAHFLISKKLMQSVLTNRFPVLLIDESQDTSAILMDALLAVQAAHKETFCLGLFGDTMQQIYTDGKANLAQSIPADWEKPSKKMNHRSSTRVVKLINKIRSSVDRQIQQARRDATEGHARLFLCRGAVADKDSIERTARAEMAIATGDSNWNAANEVKTLILEHHMAAKRMGFLEMFQPLYKIDKFKVGILDGTFPAVNLFAEVVFPLVRAKRDGNTYAIMAILRKHSLLLAKDAIKAAPSQPEQLKKVQNALTELLDAVNIGTPSFLTILKSVAKTGLFAIPDSLYPFTDEAIPAEIDAEEPEQDSESKTARLEALKAFLASPFLQIENYASYIKGVAPFGTHQGVKGLEFPRVMVIMDDAGAGGFSFSYEKLFGAKALSQAEIDKQSAGEENHLTRTRRLFYVTCSRSRNSLALVAYTANPSVVATYVSAQGWFTADEIKVLG